MKRKTIYWIIGIVIVLWYWQKYFLQSMVLGRSCMSTYGEQGIKFEGKCYKCPETAFSGGIAPLEPYIWECHKRKLTAIAMP